ncbi:MAG: hypothetical protein RL266_2162 [Bacteroidota bacterium]|jgi:plasmid maintenance system antidote protein VapI
MPKEPRNPVSSLDVGKMVRHHMLGKRMSHAMMARRLKRNQSTIRRMLHNTSVQTYLVWELSVALNHNFFSDLAAQLNAATEGKLEQQQTELEQMKQEYTKLKEEHAYLKKAIDLLSKQ